MRIKTKRYLSYILIIAPMLFIIALAAMQTAASTESTEDPFCFELTSQKSGIPAALLKAVSYVESRHKTDAINFNTNGSVDYGHMQINSLWVSKLGETYLELNDPCYCTQVGAWVLQDCINRYGYNANAISCYNTGRALDQLSDTRRTAAANYVKKVYDRYKVISSGASANAK